MLKLGGKKAEIHSEDRVPHEVWMMMKKEAQDALRWGNSGNIGLVKEYEIHSGKREGGRGCL